MVHLTQPHRTYGLLQRRTTSPGLSPRSDFSQGGRCNGNLFGICPAFPIALLLFVFQTNRLIGEKCKCQGYIWKEQRRFAELDDESTARTSQPAGSPQPCLSSISSSSLFCVISLVFLYCHLV
ncbi:hypothetical protein ANCDUO_01072 [Ancylostoma duodenale]|uniref:Uncharacterized protein n=1 Tax=Ancylostoma duodenale TaxID=51022 RepID=A0A0C2H423_9BILA|nr:hypothetical protein ANCDUO_01072 [Ancylostoma duodenale]